MIVRALCACLLVVAVRATVAAADHYGLVTFGAVPVPGATVTATRGDERRVTVTDPQGVYHFSDLVDGTWTVRVEMLGFEPTAREVAVAAEAPLPAFELTLLPFDEITRGLAPQAPEPKEPARTPNPGGEAGTPPVAAAQGGGFRRAEINSSGAAAANVPSPGVSDADRGQDAADGFLINGSVNNGAASPFAQLAAFGNNRRGARSLYNGGIGLLLGNSAWDARPFSFTGRASAETVVQRRADPGVVRAAR